ncbi:MAG: S24/S26 family peptidase [Clostridiaceae bacterium]
MLESVKVKAVELFSVVDEVFQNGGSAWITVTGMSMYPFLREGVDSVELSKTSYDSVKKYDIVLIRRKCGGYVMHRILKKDKECFYIIGDAQQWVEGPLKPEQLKAYVTRIKREKHIISVNNMLFKIASRIWMILIPFRYKIISAYSRLSRFIRLHVSTR